MSRGWASSAVISFGEQNPRGTGWDPGIGWIRESEKGVQEISGRNGVRSRQEYFSPNRFFFRRYPMEGEGKNR